MNSVIVVILTFEPDHRLIELVNNLKNYDVLIVDDGSGIKYDHVFFEMREMGIPVIRIIKGKGLL